MTIRKETSKDYGKIYHLVEEAFKTADLSDGTEQDLVNIIRQSENYIEDLSIVCEENSMLLGHVMLSKFNITGSKKTYPSLILAPLSVKLESRNKKIGSNLVNFALEKAKELGFSSVFVLGDPKYYNKFGFKESKSFNIENINDIPPEYSMCLELKEGSLKNIKGTIDFNLF